jgi:hypothetical protein
MTPITLWERITGWFGYLPVRLAYRIIWLTARLGGKTARAVELHAWDHGLGGALPARSGCKRHVAAVPRFARSDERNR